MKGNQASHKTSQVMIGYHQSICWQLKTAFRFMAKALLSPAVENSMQVELLQLSQKRNGLVQRPSRLVKSSLSIIGPSPHSLQTTLPRADCNPSSSSSLTPCPSYNSSLSLSLDCPSKIALTDLAIFLSDAVRAWLEVEEVLGTCSCRRRGGER